MTAAVITGASAGLGAEFTRQLVREFPEIEEFWLIARRVGKLEELAQQFPEKKFVCMGLNLLDPKASAISVKSSPSRKPTCACSSITQAAARRAISAQARRRQTSCAWSTSMSVR